MVGTILRALTFSTSWPKSYFKLFFLFQTSFCQSCNKLSVFFSYLLFRYGWQYVIQIIVFSSAFFFHDKIFVSSFQISALILYFILKWSRNRENEHKNINIWEFNDCLLKTSEGKIEWIYQRFSKYEELNHLELQFDLIRIWLNDFGIYIHSKNVETHEKNAI